MFGGLLFELGGGRSMGPLAEYCKTVCNFYTGIKSNLKLVH